MYIEWWDDRRCRHSTKLEYFLIDFSASLDVRSLIELENPWQMIELMSFV